VIAVIIDSKHAAESSLRFINTAHNEEAGNNA